LAALVLVRLYRPRRQEYVAGSLLLWRRLAAERPAAPPKRVIVDRSLILQAVALGALVAALAGPVLAVGGARGQALVVVLDNGPLGRARLSDGTRLWERVRAKAAAVIGELKAEDAVWVARTSPVPRMVGERVSPSDALAAVARVESALSGPSAEQAWLYAADAGSTSGAAVAVVSLRESPAAGPLSVDSGARRWLRVAVAGELANVGIVDFGSLPVVREGRAEVQVLARLRNFSGKQAEGTVYLETRGGTTQSRHCTLSAGGEAAVVFDAPREPARAVVVRWARTDGAADALPEDDAVAATPRALGAPRVRFHGGAPAVERLYRVALNAEFVPPEDAGGADLEVYAGSVPERVPEASRGVLLLAPRTGYRTVFDVGAKVLEQPRLQRDEADELTKGMTDKPGGVFPVAQACELLATGDFKTLLRDAQTQRAVAARFTDERQRLGLVLAFMPGAGLAPERLLEPELAAILVRAALEAAGKGEPFQVTRAAELERRTGEPLAAEWRPDPNGATEGAAVLDERASGVALAKGEAGESDGAALRLAEHGRSVDLRAWLIVLAMAVAGVELWLGRRR
jgi:hypothetical protein